MENDNKKSVVFSSDYIILIGTLSVQEVNSTFSSCVKARPDEGRINSNTLFKEVF